MSIPHVWTLEMRKYFAQLHRATPALTFAVISIKMSEKFGLLLTRNACIGKARRLGLPTREPKKILRKPIEKRIKAMRIRTDAPITPVEQDRPAMHHGLDIYQIRNGDCRWPLGDVMDRPPYFYCGKPSLFDSPYCPKHSAKAYNRPWNGK